NSRLILFCFLSFFLDGCAQIILKQSPAYITMQPERTARIECVATGINDFQSAYIHWYRHTPSNAPHRILYIGSGQVNYDDNSYKNKYTSWKQGKNVCTFSVNNVKTEDEGTYYCAYW
ncbi:LV321 protein, partial [Nycticryphes semicollaris]|nr:LV321 protein [Nycticryphes semicollaris]